MEPQPIDGFERIALRRQRRQSLLRIEKSQLTHPRLPTHAIAHETRIDQSVQLFFEAPLNALGLNYRLLTGTAAGQNKSTGKKPQETGVAGADKKRPARSP
jgi:hypothetical protein